MKILLLFIACSIALVSTVSSQANRSLPELENGNFPVYNFSPLDYKAADQNWCVLQDQRGTMFFGNNWGVLSYDGVNWQLIKIGNLSEVKSLGISPSGRIYVGGKNEVGYLYPNKAGSLVYESLLTLLPEKYRKFDEVWNTIAIGHDIYFQSTSYIFIWNGVNLKVIEGKYPIHNLFSTSAGLIVSFKDKGFAKIIKDSLAFFNGADRINEFEKFGLIETGNSNFLLATSENGFYTMSIHGNILTANPFKTDADDYLKKNGIYNVIHIDSSLISCGTWGGGVVLLNAEGKLIDIIDNSNLLQDLVIQNQYLDRYNNLWLVLSSGITRIEIKSKLTKYSDINGLRGTVQSVCRFNGILYAATTQGLFYLKETRNGNNKPAYDKTFQKDNNFSFECWQLLDYNNGPDEDLLIITNNTIYSLDKQNNRKLILDKVANTMLQSRLDPKRVYIGLEKGLISIYRKRDKWIVEHPFESIKYNIGSLAEEPTGKLWLGTLDEGVHRINIERIEEEKIKSFKIQSYDTSMGLPAGPYLFEIVDSKVILATSHGIFKYQLTKDAFYSDSLFSDAFGGKKYWIHRIKLDINDLLWIETFNEEAATKYLLGYFKRDRKYHWHTKPFRMISENIIHSIFPDKNAMWFGGPNGLYRYVQPGTDENSQVNFQASICNIRINGDSLIYGGGAPADSINYFLSGGKNVPFTIKYKNNSFLFSFSAYSGTEEKFMEYSYFLEGFDQSWSSWAKQTFKEFTNLSEGSYKFSVKARDANGSESRVSFFKFNILPPWYRTWPAYISFFLLGILLVYLIVALYTRGLRRIIKERTKEIVKQKDEIELKNRDITSSIQYARRIQSAILPPVELMDELLPQRFILYLPRDIVSGDFYWMTKKDNLIYVVVADCTGHGVPGAMMSMLGMAFLNESLSKGESKPHDILNYVRSQIIDSMRQKGQTGENQDGMDIAIFVLDLQNMSLEFSGANLSLHLYRNGQLNLLKGEKMPLGISAFVHKPFTSTQTGIEKGDMIYLFTDGYQDQFGGPDSKRYLINNLRCLLSEISEKTINEQLDLLLQKHHEWKSTEPQVDDITIIGIRI